jgi:CRP-like cAMP-binding protein
VRAFIGRTGSRSRWGPGEGAFFGEVSILTGKPRSASIVALTNCELLELGKATLDDIVKKHPHVLEVMQEFSRERTARHPAS